jgi:hypothetical protein
LTAHATVSRDRFLSLVVTHVEALALECWTREMEQWEWTPEQNAAVAQYVAELVRRIVLLDIST